MAQPTFSCESCGKTHSWKAELAGRKARCKCGNVVTVPATAPGAEPELDALYDLIPSEKDLNQNVPAAAVAADGAACPACSAAVVPGAVLCVQCGYNFQTGSQVQTAAAPAKKKAARKGPTTRTRGRGPGEVQDTTPASELTIPATMAVAGAALSIWAIMHGTSAGLGIVMVAFLVAAVIQSVMIFAGCLLSIKLAGISLGHPVSAIVKVLALAVAPAAVEMLLTKVTGFWYFGWSAALVMYYLMLHSFFELDGGETLFVAAIIYVVGMGAQLLIGLLLLQMGIAPIVATGGMGGLNTDTKTDEKQALIDEEDSHAEMLQLPWIEGRTYLKDEKNQLRGLKREELVRLVDDFYARGAVNVTLRDSKMKNGAREAAWLIIELPPVAKAKLTRKSLFEYHQSTLKKYNATEKADDIGQRFLRFTIAGTKPEDDDAEPDK